MNWLSKRLHWVMLLACASLFYLPLGSRALWNSAEGRIAEIAREMLERGDWLVPHLNYVVSWDHPPLLYVLTAASLAVFGETEFAARFWCATFGLLTVLLVYLLGRRWKGERVGLLSGVVLATSVLFFALTQFLVLDMALTFWLVLSLYASAGMLTERLPGRVRRWSSLLILAVVGGVLTKGLVAVAFPIAALLLVIAYTRFWTQMSKIPWQEIFLCVGLLSAPWYVMMALKHPDFLSSFFVREPLQSFFAAAHPREAPLYFYLPVLAAAFLPWSVFLPYVLTHLFRHRAAEMNRDPVKALLFMWSVIITLFYSCSQTKLVASILPVLPALALLCGDALEEALEEPRAPGWVQKGVLGLVVIFSCAVAVLKLPQAAVLFQDPAAEALRAHAGLLSFMLSVIVTVLVGVWGMRQTMAALVGLVMAQVLFFGSLPSLANPVDPFLSNKAIARQIGLRSKPLDRTLTYGISFENVAQTLPFYLKRRVAIFGDPGELAMGADKAPEAAEWIFPQPESAAALARMPQGTWVVTSDVVQKQLTQAGPGRSLELVMREGKLILLRKIK